MLRKALPRSRAGAQPAQPRSLTALVTERIREAIVDGRFALGEALSELKLAAALNVSRTPVRDALTALQLQGLIDVRPQSGSFVFLPSEEDVAELAEFRRVLEMTALRFCFARRRDEALRADARGGRCDGARAGRGRPPRRRARGHGVPPGDRREQRQRVPGRRVRARVRAASRRCARTTCMATGHGPRPSRWASTGP